MDLLFLNIKELIQANGKPAEFLAGKEMATLQTIRNAFLLVSDEMIVDFGSMSSLGDHHFENSELLMEIDCSGRLVFPSFCDPDSHLLYPYGSPLEFSVHSSTGKRGYMFKDSFTSLPDLTGEELYCQALDYLKEVVKKGTGAIEIKSGYGLDPEEEIKLLQVIRRLKRTTPLVIKSTFLGSHIFPESVRKSPTRYMDQVLDVLPTIAQDELADNLDLYYDPGFLTRSESEQLLFAGLREGLNVKIHSDELGLTRLNNENVKVSLDIMEHSGQITSHEIKLMVENGLFPVIMPGASFFHNLSATSAREMIDAGLPLALATDFDPGSMPSCDMKFMQSLACIKYGMKPEEVINASTQNSAFLMGIGEGYGSISKGKAANLFVTKRIPSYQYFPYAFSSDLIEMVILDGEMM